MIFLQNIDLSFGVQTIFDNISLSIQKKQRIAIVGQNGAGKTTFFRLILEEIQPDHGELTKEKGLVISYLPQQVIQTSTVSAIEMALTAFTHYQEMEEEINRMQGQLGEISDKNQLDELLQRIGEKQTVLETHHYFQKEKEAAKVLEGLGIKEKDFQKPVQQFSGGWQMRILLAKILLNPGHVLLLDEPTNHLDLPTIQWLEDYLRDYEGAILLISHDRYFINHLADEIWFFNRGRIHRFPGNYENFLEQWEEHQIQAQKKVERIQRKATQFDHYISRFRSKARHASNVQSKIKQMQRLQDELPELITSTLEKTWSFKLPNFDKGGARTILVENLSKAYQGRTIFNHISFEMLAGEKVALIGANGEGKSTLTRLISGIEKPDSGLIQYGHRVKIAYYSQMSDQMLNPENSIYDELFQHASTTMIPHIRSILGGFLFSGDEVLKKIKLLSGGERTRVSFAKFLLSDANFLILDEPTNHLDIPSKEALFTALSEYEGSILLVTHDRYFLNLFAQKIFHIANQQLKIYLGNYDCFKNSIEIETAPSAGTNPTATLLKEKSSSRDIRRENALRRQSITDDRKKMQLHLKELEQQIADYEQEYTQIEHLLCQPDAYKNEPEFVRLNRRYKEIPAQLEQAYQEWSDTEQLLNQLLESVNLNS
ncbi:MAG: ABC-F family ATP-binding cassette domain-containing protein [Candidatus Delongbacteria bacterium]|nr:ABC-F family ATP-binding cassette domain-containing protein [Candidatus Delongbacteria bacterium]